MKNCIVEALQRKSHTRKKKRIAVIAALICCAAIVATGTLAYFSAEETAYNVITTGSLTMELVEETTGGKPWPKDGVSGILPGGIVDKVVYVKNTGETDFYTRISLEKVITAAKGVNQELNFDHITLDINTKNWTEKDGFYYYNRALKAGEATEPLFTTVTFGGALGNEYMDAHIQIKVNAQAVQSKNNAASPLEASGWIKSK